MGVTGGANIVGASSKCVDSHAKKYFSNEKQESAM